MGTKNANHTSVVIPGEHRAFPRDAREGDPGGEYRVLHRLLGSLPLAKLKLREAGNDSFEIVSSRQGGITQ
jgi:hypothetical protein